MFGQLQVTKIWGGGQSLKCNLSYDPTFSHSSSQNKESKELHDGTMNNYIKQHNLHIVNLHRRHNWYSIVQNRCSLRKLFHPKLFYLLSFMGLQLGGRKESGLFYYCISGSGMIGHGQKTLASDSKEYIEHQSNVTHVSYLVACSYMLFTFSSNLKLGKLG